MSGCTTPTALIEEELDASVSGSAVERPSRKPPPRIQPERPVRSDSLRGGGKCTIWPSTRSRA